LVLKAVLTREWVRRGGNLSASDARAIFPSTTSNPEWGEKVERVWEFLVDTGGLSSLEQENERSEGEERMDSVSAKPDATADTPVVNGQRPPSSERGSESSARPSAFG